MDQDIPHSHYALPRCLAMTVTESGGKIICGFSYNFYVFHYTIKHQHVATKIIQRHITDIGLNTFDSIFDVL